MGNCDNFKKYFSDYLDGNLPQKLKINIENHLGDCTECRELIRGLKITRNLLNSLPEVKASSDFESRLRERIIGTECSESSPVFSFLSTKMAVVSGTVIVLLCVAIGSFKFGVFTKNDVQPNMAPAISNEIPDNNLNVVPIKKTNRSGAQPPNRLLTEKLSQIDTTDTGNGANDKDVNQRIKYIKGK